MSKEKDHIEDNKGLLTDYGSFGKVRCNSIDHNKKNNLNAEIVNVNKFIDDGTKVVINKPNKTNLQEFNQIDCETISAKKSAEFGNIINSHRTSSNNNQILVKNLDDTANKLDTFN